MNHYGVSKKTALKDVMFLSSILPLEAHPGNGGGIFLKMEYDAPRVYLTDNEKDLLLRLIDSVCVEEKRLLINIINKFTLP